MTGKFSGPYASDLSPDELKRRVHALRVQIPSHLSAIEAIQACMDGSKYSAEPKSLFIGGDTGMGKSTLIKSFAAKYPREHRDVVDRIPVVVASIPAVATTKSTASNLLKQLGDPKAFNGELAKLTDRLLTYLERCETELIVLDEFQHIIDRESSKVRATTADWLKTIVEGSGLPLVLVGLPHSEKILNENIQLDRRFHRRIFLSRFTLASEHGRAEFRTLLHIVGQNLPFHVSADLDQPRIAEWIFKRTHGLLGPTMALIREAAEFAIDDKAAGLQREHVEAAYERIRGSRLRLENVEDTPSTGSLPRVGSSLGEVLRT